MNPEQMHCSYQRPQLMEVICQLRFPTILSIGASDPVAFQEKVRAQYPRFQSGTAADGAQSGRSYQFISAEGRWKVSLTSSFLALSTMNYRGWAEFAARLDELLVSFIEVYRPEFFERVGLRYINAFSRGTLGLGATPFCELFSPAYLGLLSAPGAREADFTRAAQDAELGLPGGGRAKLHCGPGRVKRGASDDPEVKYLLDIDCFLGGRVELYRCAPALNQLHEGAYGLFRGALTERLHQAMGPLEVM